MKFKSLPLVLPLFLTISGCSIFGSEPPKKAAKPVVKAPANAQHGQANAPKPVTPGPKTYALDGAGGSFNGQSTLSSVPNFRDQQIAGAGVTAPAAAATASGAVSGALSNVGPIVAAPTTGTVAAPQTTDTQTAMLTPAVPAAPAPAAAAAAVPVAVTLEDANIPAGTSPAVVALLTDADRSVKRGDLNNAVVVTERALGIDARNPTITYKLAQLRLKQGKAPQAEELANKAALLAGGDLELKRKSWMLIAESRNVQHNIQGAREAKAKAESFFGR